MTIAFHSNGNFPQVSAPKSAEQKAYEAQIKDTIFSNMAMVDTVDIKPKETEKPASAPEVGFARIIFHRFTPEQISQVNESKELPKNAKFYDGVGYVGITWNLIDFTTGTHTLPVGYELKNDILGFTHVVREGTKNIFLK